MPDVQYPVCLPCLLTLLVAHTPWGLLLYMAGVWLLSLLSLPTMSQSSVRDAARQELPLLHLRGAGLPSLSTSAFAAFATAFLPL